MLNALTATATPSGPLGLLLEALAGEEKQTVPRTFVFGAFILQPERQLLLRDGVPVRIGGRSLDILTALVEQPGVLVGKNELLKRVWPHTYVDEANLKSNVALLRRALGERHCTPKYIATIVGRGYRFITSVRSAGGPFEGRAGAGSPGYWAR